MARISFTAPERGGLLAKAVLDVTNDMDPSDAAVRLDELHALAAALADGNGREFDERLTVHFRDVALASLAGDDGPADGQVELEPETQAG